MQNALKLPAPEKIYFNLIDPPANAHRIDIAETELCELADDIRRNGLINPITVRRTPNNRFEILAGHRRYLAHGIAGLDTIECRVFDCNDAQAEAIRFAENEQRSSLSPMEQARALALMFPAPLPPPREIARKIHRSEHWVLTRLQLLDLYADLQTMVHLGSLPISHALLLGEVDDDHHRAYLLHYVQHSGASTVVLREWVAAYHASKTRDPDAPPPLPTIPNPNQPIVVQMPCYICGTSHDHTQLLITRTCAACHAKLQGPT